MACDRGSVTAFTAIFSLALLLLTGLVVDGGAKLRAASHANAVAAEAARAGAEAADTRGRTLTIDPQAAIAAADAYLHNAGAQGEATIAGPAQISVTVHQHGKYLIRGILGASDYTVTGHATANLQVTRG